MTPTTEQTAVIDFARSSGESLLVNALAGAAKTTTLVMAAHAMPLTPTFCGAFNKRIAVEMGQRMPPHIQCSTLNSIGHRVWSATVRKRLIVNTDKTYTALRAVSDGLRPEERARFGDIFASLLKAVRAAKSAGYVPSRFLGAGKSLCTLDDLVELIAPSCDVDPDDEFMFYVDQALERSIAEAFDGKIDFDDQIYMSTLFGGSYPRFPVTMIDEAQDLSPLNHETLKLMFGGRLIAVGDPNQAIYAFRGAHTSSMAVMKGEFKMSELTLSTSFRCPRAVIRKAQARVPHMTWPEWAVEGAVTPLDSWSISDVPDGSAVICRNNAPLFAAAMRFIRQGRGVKIVGSDIGKSLVKLLGKMGDKSDSREDVLRSIAAWREKELKHCKKSREGPINDRAECLEVFAQAGETLAAAIAFAEHLFAASGPVEFLTGHKSKGNEWDNVFHLNPYLIPSKWALRSEDPAAMEQELNLKYVVETRAKQNLFLVNLEDMK